jgi:hypothetical protein
MLWWTPERECDLEQISWSCLCSVVGLELTLEKFEERAVRSLRHRKAGGVRHRRTGGESGIGVAWDADRDPHGTYAVQWCNPYMAYP